MRTRDYIVHILSTSLDNCITDFNKWYSLEQGDKIVNLKILTEKLTDKETLYHLIIVLRTKQGVKTNG